MKSSSPTDRVVQIITAIYFILIALPLAQALNIYAGPGPFGEASAMAAITLVLAGIGIYCRMLAPRRFEFDREEFRIVRPAGTVRIPLKEIDSVDEVPREALRGLIRTFGVGGLFGYFGRFYNDTLGDLRMYATRRNGLVMVVTLDGIKRIISPADPSFAAGLRGAVQGANGNQI